jgi:hypothetical protein
MNNELKAPPAIKKWDCHRTTFLKAEFWEALKSRMSDVTFPKDVLTFYADASLRVYDKHYRTTVKVTTAGEVQVELKIGKCGFKSESFTFTTAAESIDSFISLLEKYFDIKSAVLA